VNIKYCCYVLFSKVSEIYIIWEKENLYRGIEARFAALPEMVLTIEVSRDVTQGLCISIAILRRIEASTDVCE
jgi:hypothetical protein